MKDIITACKTKNMRLFNSFVFLFFFTISTGALADEKGYSITQGEFAVQLVNVLNLQSYLPSAPLKTDYVTALELFGISPLRGWDARLSLTEEDYLVVMSKLSGQEQQVYKTGVEFCNKIVQTINDAWTDQQSKDGKWETLQELYQDSRYFNGDIPQCPFGFHYHERRGQHVISHHTHAQRFLTSLRFK